MDLVTEREGKRSSRPQGAQVTSGMESLPREIAIDILSRLPITSLMQFKCVCRAWRLLAQDPRLPIMHLALSTENNPCLILHCDYPIRNQLYFVEIDATNGYTEAVRKIKTPFGSVMPEFDIAGSSNGLLCLSDALYCDPVHIYNPFTGYYIELPKLNQYTDQEVVFEFGFHLELKVYKVVRIVYTGLLGRAGYKKSVVQVFTLGTNTWRNRGHVPYQIDRRRPSEALVNGALHWVTRRRRVALSQLIVSFDLADEEFREVPRPECGGLDKCTYHLVVLGGCLSAAVYCTDGRIEVWVMKDYNVKESWIKEFTVGSYVPVGLNQDVDRPPFSIWKNGLSGRLVRLLCLLKNGDILLEYKSKALVSYDPERQDFKDLTIRRLPNWFQTFIHVGSLISVDGLLGQKDEQKGEEIR
ncbi:hypothetical protein HHK36_005752 [Tetracentron sinense]|uniref:F-box domain-containing protein n=1 Tax=Tetracentron sinense TaxID=13715 RepID=A0A834ZQX3_TETSI|nr:hypothetical protein HHK36_005752 [Tetracentron sinense]